MARRLQPGPGAAPSPLGAPVCDIKHQTKEKRAPGAPRRRPVRLRGAAAAQGEGLRLRGAQLSRERRGRCPGDAGGAGAAMMAAAAAAAGPRRGRLGREARASLAAFLLGASVAALPVALGSPSALLAAPGLRGRLALALHVAGVNAALLLLYPRPLYKIAIRACFLGFAFGCGLLLSTGRSAWRHFGWYMCSLSLFHYSEYLVTAINNPRSLSLDSFLLNHSFEYNLAALSSWVEFTLEKLLFPELKQITWLSTVGLLMVIFGDCLRKAAMLTAGSNFNHIVQNEKSDTHTLVTSGVYGWFRHPSYVGWFYWSIGTQVLLCNPICMVGYALVSWRFFRERIEEEEITLIHFFGEEYLEYKRKVPSGLPFIRGVRVEL
uniref:Protein-S-isoprenylcysteine O-methyltransferase n=2 Tax=Accipitrinae TaxID=8955 RepID=A0A8B9MLU9_9AVES